MPDARRVAEQWLETDAAFGVTEAPIGRARGEGTAGVQAKPAVAVPIRVQVAVAKPMVQNAPAPARPAATASFIGEDSVARARKAAPVLPAPPEGAIGDLPALTRDEKMAQLAALEARAAEDLAAHITEISTRLVFGEGDADAPIMFIGEGPGIEEDRQGRPFVGRSGQLLDKQILAMGYQRAQVFIANIVKLRAASFDETEGRVKDRPPTPEEVARQIHILHEQIAIIRPRAIVTLGAPAVKWLTGTTEGVMKIRGTWLDHRGVPVMPTYHPAFLLRAYTPENRKKVWEDLQKVMELLGKKKSLP